MKTWIVAALAALALALSGPAHPQQEPDPDLDPAFLDDDDGEEDEDGDEGPPGDVEDDDDLDDEDWWLDVEFDESDDAIPTDEELDPEGAGWEVIDFEDDGDGFEDAVEAWVDEAEGVRASGDMPVVRSRARRAPRPGDSAGGEDTPYSFGGKPIRDAGAPWQAQIFYPGKAPRWDESIRKGTPLWQLQHFCGGTLIADDWVLTAAHCIDDGMVRAGYKVRLGAEDISRDDGMVFRIERIVRHSQYAHHVHPKPPASPLPPPNMYANDIALIRIVPDGPPRPRDPKQIQPVRLYQGPVPGNGTQVTGSGWGKTAPVDDHAPNAVLLKVDMQVMDTATCQARPGYGPERISDKVICAARKGQSTCRGDSGGPLTLTNEGLLVGIISWGKSRCNGDGQPGVYTSIVAYADWIRQAMSLPPTRSALP